MKKRILIASLLLVFLAGLLLFSYPKLSGIVTDRQTLNRTDVVIRWLETARAEQVEGDDEPLTAEEEEIYPPDMPQHHHGRTTRNCGRKSKPDCATRGHTNSPASRSATMG